MHGRYGLPALILVVAALVLFAGCTGGQGGGTPTPIETTLPTITPVINETPTLTTNMTANETVTATPRPPAGPVALTLTAEDFAFDRSTIEVPAGAKVTITFENRDPGVEHNVAFYETSAAEDVIFKGDLVTGPGTATYTFTAPSEPGTYFFRCDPHATRMRGDFVVT
ncbi:plastocyanin/azurin family copper-binding protein [Methanofollis ethanolicus]|uniref:plastocyanin/azurin family copper-binding protein n=1 Tax=Methanofollis ethanolicus TaxID=488124 RepID=UPI0008320C99|nr:cupredoxin domain-containing protein [Methanofollis ethanolicus]